MCLRSAILVYFVGLVWGKRVRLEVRFNSISLNNSLIKRIYSDRTTHLLKVKCSLQLV